MKVRFYLNIDLIRSADPEILGKHIGGADMKQMGIYEVIKNCVESSRFA
jgi:hypothetical protein